MRGFEPPTPWPRDRYATRLRYIPTLFSNDLLYHLLGLRVVFIRSVFLCSPMARSVLVFRFAWRPLLLAFHSSHSLICFCKSLISSAWASIILSFSDERFILNFFKSDFFADSKSASPKNKLYFILYKNYTNWGPRTDYTGEGRINDWRFREDCKEVLICTSDLTALTEEVGTNLH